jgi:hypothetical protein
MTSRGKFNNRVRLRLSKSYLCNSQVNLFKIVKLCLFFSLLAFFSGGCDLQQSDTSSKKPKAPSNLQYSVTSQKLTFTWTDNSTDEMEFHVERNSAIDAEWKTIWRTGANDTEYQMNVFQIYPNSSYRVTAYNLNGYSDPSNEVYVPTYNSASLMIYICPNFYNGCQAGYLDIDGNCRTLQNLTLGEWYDTGFDLTTNHDYAIQFCGGCVSNCGQATAFSTPRAFLTTKYYSSIYGYCKDACTPPETSKK